MLYVNPMASAYVARADSVMFSAARERVALQELEHYFVYTLLQEMRKSVGSISGTRRTAETRFYEELLDDALSGEIAASGQFGLARQIQEQLHAAEIQARVQPEPQG